MDIQLKKISPEEFDTFYNNFPGEKTFLQTSKYGVYRKKMGEDVFLYGIFKEDELGGIVLIQKVKARRGTFFHVPHGPVLKWEGNERMK